LGLVFFSVLSTSYGSFKNFSVTASGERPEPFTAFSYGIQPHPESAPKPGSTGIQPVSSAIAAEGYCLAKNTFIRKPAIRIQTIVTQRLKPIFLQFPNPMDHISSRASGKEYHIAFFQRALQRYNGDWV
jgi:hypothetical protein